MTFIEITENLKTTPGEYIYHKPTKQIVMCGSFNRKKNQIRAMARGKLFADEIQNFNKIQLSKQDRKDNAARECGGCKG
mgnify:CR=1 FL=1